MNETRKIAFDAALTIASIHGVDYESAEDLLDMAKRFESYLDGSESYVESGADAEAVADALSKGIGGTGGFGPVEMRGPGVDAWRLGEKPSPFTPFTIGAGMALGAGAAAPSTAADGPPPREAGATSQGPESSSPKKPRKKNEAKKAKTRREKKVKTAGPVETTTAEALGDELPHAEPAPERAMEEAA
jgi:hypothetical protein